MSRYSSITPEGTSDLLFKDCDARRGVEHKMINVFKSLGYSEVVTPSLEFYDVFDSAYSAIPQEMMYKLIDTKGRILVMRPDNTTPLARVAATRLKDFEPPLRLYYNQNVFRISPSMSGRRDEVPQCGVELIGCGGKKSDLEVIYTAIKALKTVCAGADIRFEIGHVGYYKSIINELPFEEQQIEQIRSYIESKNYAALSDVLKPYSESTACGALLALPRLFGGEEVFQTAAAPNGTAQKILDYLRDIYQDLCLMGLKDNIMIDLGLVHQIDYYTGIVFRGYMQGSGDTVVSGGRYDSLLKSFGKDWQATGFAVNTSAVAKAIEKPPVEHVPVIIFYKKEYCRKAFAHMEEMIASGTPCEMSVFETLEQTMNYAKLKGIGRVDNIGEAIDTTMIKED